jgi:ribosomal-protein-alanine N-acetyltransferase
MKTRVIVRTPRAEDRREFLALVQKSRRVLHPWAQPASDAYSFARYLERVGRDDFAGRLICRKLDGAIMGGCSLSQIFYGPLRSAYLGYWLGAGFVGQGYMTEAMVLILRLAFVDLKLHRLEANIQPENERSLALVQRCGFRREGFSPRYLKIAGRWRDHERWAITVDDWSQVRKAVRKASTNRRTLAGVNGDGA